MASRSLRNRLSESTNIWPGFVDVLATLLIVIIFVLMVFTVSQIYLSDALSGRDKALQELRTQISELSKILQLEISEKEEALKILTKNKTTIVIAHRLSTIIRADKIIVINQGKITDMGTHKELLENSIIYKNLYSKQLSA